ncbi:putative glutathione S-transferase with thioredoxin-like domain and glutathione S-transferase, C-terminal domain [Xenorhabdus nematophila ATCC 19061]|uniref:Glutathione S-transferase with thioredoxin-like domain and glutathione S-transferase, C-terminal domain n=1 Tax=Xenorhabdus nematophila (strain ATCC 19061 / DSM 3370 / CCUG 14189 / LMG 1036 / NCIMB 9965 / AN6) TaxID=406817 RepID=D3VBE6_XENNA|nr:glutathione S-transferase family protein [Xenorhabdus nematophila]CBJ89585.1 putative glutathione S-transferase with thioredoxin-like domain and glutathione S-transferase, C-terminal domain [Xenorhabdus nematophila ATCC 19061]CEK22475.1 putative glutathione S-transferase with thioredoxin-like domain and glutathione S-transferase, C-terminal domain [Xenorhabdus nematophila AN6/1]
MLTVWGRKNSSNVKKVLWCLEELNVPYQQVDIGGKFGKLNEPEYLRMNPNAVIPCLQEGDFILWESNVIVRYIAAKFGQDSLYPTDLQERASVEKWMDWVSCNMFPPIKQLMINVVRTPKDQQNPEIISQILSEIKSLLKMVDNTLGNQPYLSGDKFGMADIALAPLVYPWLNVEVERPSLPNLERWYQLLTKRPAFQKIVMIEIN